MLVVVGLTGTLCSGKGVLASYSDGKGLLVLSLSNEVRMEALDRKIFKATRHDLQNIGNDLRKDHGIAVLAERVFRKLTSDISFVVFDGIRNPGEIDFFRKNIPGFLLVAVDAPTGLRKEWWIERAKERKEDDPSEEGFKKADARDRGEGEANSGQQVEACMRLADVHLYNDHTGVEGKERLKQLFRISIKERFGIDIETLLKTGKERLK